MKTKRGFVQLTGLLCIGVSFAGCAGSKFNQTAPRSGSQIPLPASRVQLFEAGNSPARSFEVISALSTASYSDGSFRKAMLDTAGKLGADAVVGVHSFHAPRTLGIHLQSGIAVRWLSRGQPISVSEAKPGVALVTLLEAPIENTNTFAEIRDTMLLIGGLQLHTMGYCPIYANAPLPSGTNVPSAVTFDLLKDSESSLCEKMLVLRLTRRSQQYVGLGGHADVEIKAHLISRADNSVLWTNTLQLKRVGIGPAGGINVASTAFMGQAAAKAIRDMPKSH